MASIKTLCAATEWLDRPVASVPAKRFARFRSNALSQIGLQLGDDARACADIDWCGVRCSTAVALTLGVVHKVAIVVTSPRERTGNLLNSVAACVERHLGDHPTTAIDGLLVFDGEGGTVVVQEVVGSAPTNVIVYVTSSSPATLTPITASNQK